MRVSNEECSPTRLGHTFRPIHVARCIVNTNHSIMPPAENLCARANAARLTCHINVAGVVEAVDATLTL
jgi:hypothetical protein